MAGTSVSFSATSTINSGVASSMTAVKTLASGSTAVYAYLPTATSNGSGATFWISHDGTSARASMTEMVVKWDDRSTQQGICSPSWAITVHGPIDYVIDKSSDTGATITEFL